MTQPLNDAHIEQDDPNEVICSMMDEILALTQEIVTLTHQRDLLLAMLLGVRGAPQKGEPT